MTFSEFQDSLEKETPPNDLITPLIALWYDGKGDWDKAHSYADGPSDKISARVHAYLHRKEGDQWNADYWYKRAGEGRTEVSLEEEWEMLVRRLLS